MTWRGPLSVGRWGLLVLPVAVLAQEPAKGPHGAAPMEQQRQLADQLVGTPDLSKPPVGIDPALWAMVVPDKRSPALVALGRKLYFEPALSSDGTVACATCHDVTRSFTDRRNVSEGVGDQVGHRNAPTTMNAVLLASQFWDGRAPSLAEQARQPILNPVEMGHTDEGSALSSLKKAGYEAEFKSVFGRDLNYADMSAAIAAYETTLIFLDAPYDAWIGGDESAISESAKRGFALYNGKARCTACHPIHSTGPLGTDHRFHNVGVSARHQDFEGLARQALTILAQDSSMEKLDELAITTNLSELGRFMVTRNRADIGAFRTPQVRNVGVTGPYMHDGSLQTLWDVMDHYNKGGEANRWLDGGIEPLALTEAEIDDVVAFMFALTDKRFAELNRKELEQQKARAATTRPFRDEALAMRKVLPFESRVSSPGGEK
jgi:cytochrome c peroxidase